MSKLFIVEGPDCSGKTSLCRAICRARNAVYLHASGKKSLHQAMLDYHLSLIEVARENMNLGHDVVFDRLWVSEYVYGRVLRLNVTNHVYDYNKIFEKLDPLEPIHIFCMDTDVITRHHEQNDEDHPYDDFVFSQIVGKYRDFVLSHPPSGRWCEYSILENGSSIKLQEFIASLP